MHHFYLILSNPEHVVLSIWVGVVVPQVTGIQLVPVICENPPVSETSLQQKYNLSNFENVIYIMLAILLKCYYIRPKHRPGLQEGR